MAAKRQTLAQLLGEPKPGPKVKLTREQKAALAAYEHQLREEDRYFGSVFVDTSGTDRIKAKTKEAYDACLRLGMTWEHGL